MSCEAALRLMLSENELQSGITCLQRDVNKVIVPIGVGLYRLICVFSLDLF